jgi:hypothetical protein
MEYDGDCFVPAIDDVPPTVMARDEAIQFQTNVFTLLMNIHLIDWIASLRSQ